jgi:hypothetical protein
MIKKKVSDIVFAPDFSMLLVAISGYAAKRPSLVDSGLLTLEKQHAEKARCAFTISL